MSALMAGGSGRATHCRDHFWSFPKWMGIFLSASASLGSAHPPELLQDMQHKKVKEHLIENTWGLVCLDFFIYCNAVCKWDHSAPAWLLLGALWMSGRGWDCRERCRRIHNSNRLCEARPPILERKPERKLKEKWRKMTEGESGWEWIER